MHISSRKFMQCNNLLNLVEKVISRASFPQNFGHILAIINPAILSICCAAQKYLSEK